jgi:signal transduction histidine kinase
VAATPDEDAGPVERSLSEIANLYAGDDAYVASIQLKDGSWANYVIRIAPAASLWTPETLGFVAAVIALVLLASVWALRRLTLPYGLIANAAERFGRDLNAAPLPERGPSELRGATHAFNLMRERLQRLVADRNQMVAAITHDVRTPLTRLRLRADFVDDSEQRARMIADIDEIETMTRSVLAFASDTAEPEPRAALDIVSLLETISDETPGASLELPAAEPARLPYAAQPTAMRRCISNLVDNAIKYGKRARLSLDVRPGAIHIVVADDGPGIPEGDRETVFRPFRRLETSRNRDTGGTGLGLTIARSVARAHGGDVILSNRPEGGLTAEIVLPLPGLATPGART